MLVAELGPVARALQGWERQAGAEASSSMLWLPPGAPGQCCPAACLHGGWPDRTIPLVSPPALRRALSRDRATLGCYVASAQWLSLSGPVCPEDTAPISVNSTLGVSCLRSPNYSGSSSPALGSILKRQVGGSQLPPPFKRPSLPCTYLLRPELARAQCQH